MTYLPVSDRDFLLLRLKFHRNQSANWVSQPRHPHTKETALGDVGNWCSDCNKELRSQRQDLPSRGDGEGLVLSQNRQVQTRPLWTSGILWSIKTARVLLILNKSTVQNQSTTGTMMLRERTSMILPFNYMTLFAIHIPLPPPPRLKETTSGHGTTKKGSQLSADLWFIPSIASLQRWFSAVRCRRSDCVLFL